MAAANGPPEDAQTRPRAHTHPATGPPSRSERMLNQLTDKGTTVNDVFQPYDLSNTLRTVGDASSTEDILAPLRVLLSSLEHLTKVHPFLAVAVIPFKAVVALEVKRRENDRRVLVVIAQMADMLSHLGALPAAPIGSAAQTQLHDLLVTAKSNVVQCGNAIDVYYKTKLIVKILKAFSWQEKWEEFVQTFRDLKDTLKMKILLVLHGTAGDIKSIVSSTDQKIDEVLKLLKRRTSVEDEMNEFITSHGGIKAFVDNDDVMRYLVKKCEGLVDAAGGPGPPRPSAAPDPPPRGTFGSTSGPQRQGSGGSMYPEPYAYGEPNYTSYGGPTTSSNRPAGSYSGYPGPSVQRQSSLSSRYPARQSSSYTVQGPSSIAATWGTSPFANTTARTADAYGPSSVLLQSMRSAAEPQILQTTRMTMRTGVASRSAEAEYLDTTGSVKPLLLQQYRDEIRFALSTDLSVILRRNEQVWTFKLRHLTNDIKIHFDHGTNKVLRAINGGPHERIKHNKLRYIWETEKWRGSVSGMQFLQAVQDFMVDEPQVATAESRSEAWAMKFLGVSYRVPLLHVIDPDLSGFVSVAEANKFTEAKPPGLSLLLWLTYCATAWVYEANECRKRIRASWDRLVDLSIRAQVPDEAILDFEASVAPDLEVLVGGIRASPRRIADISEHPALVALIMSRLAEKVKLLEDNLEKVNWDLDSESTLAAVAGDGAVETYLFPLLAVLLERLVRRVEDASTNISSGDISSAKDTFQQVFAAVDERFFFLVDCFPPEVTFELSFGLFSQWNPKELPVEPMLPRFSSVPTSPEEAEAPTTTTLHPLDPVEEESAEPSLPETAATSSESVISKTPTPSVLGPPEDVYVDEKASLKNGYLDEKAVPPLPSSASVLNPEQSVENVSSSSHGAGDATDPNLLAMAPLFYVEALYPYTASDSTDMDLEPGDRIAVIATPESGWWIGKQLNEARDLPGKTTFPSNYVTLLRGLD